ncbi:MAG: transposase [Dehalococcoidia bacterium]|nr:transposase [Dehalococcoidia bacterium]
MRLKAYDYSKAGAYFVTVVAQDRLCLFGDVIEDEMHVNRAGAMVSEVWRQLPSRFPTIELDAFVVMPNHVHGIVVLNLPVGVPLVGTLGDEDRATTRVAPTLGDVVGAYKSITTVRYTRGVKVGLWNAYQGRLWQRNYYEHVIRNESELNRAREYIVGNPALWVRDRENPEGFVDCI